MAKQDKANTSRRTGPEPRLGGIIHNPAPDAEDRLRRLFTILAQVLENEPSIPGTGPSPEDGGGREEC